MATLLRTDGSAEALQPPNGTHWTLAELQTLVGGYIEIIRTVDGKFMVIDEEGKLAHKRKALNRAATMIYVHGRRDPIVGDALLVDTRFEINGNGPEEDEGD